MRLKDKVAIITGGAAGIGAKIVERFVSEGAQVCVCDYNADALKKTAETFAKESVFTYPGDVSQLGDVEQMVCAAIDFAGRVDILVNNAGVDAHGSAIDVDPEEWQRVLDINVNGPLWMSKAVIPQMIKTGGGAIVNIASLSAIRSLPDMSAYCSSKGALLSLTKQVALDYGPSNIRCNVICPGPVRAGLLQAGVTNYAKESGVDEESAFSRLTENVPLRRVAAPEEVASACLFLAGDESSFITGATLVVDGGLSVVDPFSITMRDMPGVH